MKKVVVIMCLFLAFLPIMVGAKSKTLNDFKNEVASLEAKKQKNKQLSKEASNSIDNKRNAILDANKTIENNTNKVEEAKINVAEGQEQVKIKTEELKDIINILQYASINDSEIYVDYLFNANNMSDLIERQAVVEQVVNYTKKQLEELDDLIKTNEKLQVDLAIESEKLNKSIVSYEKQVEELEAYIDSLATIGLDYDEQIKAQKNLIKMFEDAGCKNSDSVDDCYYNKGINSSSFSRPLNYGVVTQAWGNNGHKGVDIGGNKKGTNVYAPANGTVIYVRNGITYLKNKGTKSCGGHIVYIHYNVGGKAYTSEFAHLTSYKVKAGDKVTKGQVIATVGGDSSTWYYDKCTTGTHLHYAIAYGYYLATGTNGYTSWNTYASNTKATGVQSITGIKNTKGWKWTAR